MVERGMSMSRLFSGTPFERPISCPKCHQAVADCRCLNLPDKKATTGTPNKKPAKGTGLVLNPKNAIAPADQVAKIRVEKRKGNRMVTVIGGLDHPANDLVALCTELKRVLGTGGSVQNSPTTRMVELQGEHAEKVLDYLEVEMGIKGRILK